MLELSNIVKNYALKDQTVAALKQINVCFRRSEFVSILGPSGCGKTTLLNIIGGLDKYTSGDLIIEGVSTKDYKDKDWDNYRNHRVGFVFQSYNLIPHQTVLENVELALTLSGIKKAERHKRAKEVLEKVGLGDKLKSKPNQLSGGQMQRVAIARALVNDPEIILADEPTGALDSKTSVQIMELLKEVSKNKLVIMVTHNPELAEKYSSRIIRLLDGEIIEDSKPYTQAQANKEIEKHAAKVENLQDNGFKKTKKKKSMSIFTAMFLSLKNLLTKKGRTILVAIAGSIGIMGISLIMAVSAGMTNYINTMQSESLSSYPISISALSVDLDKASKALLTNDSSNSTSEEEIPVYNMKESLKDFGKYNYLSQDFVDYITDYYNQDSKKDYINDFNVSYSSDMLFLTLMHSQTIDYFYPLNSNIVFSAFDGSTSSTFFEGLDNKDYILSMYNKIGEYPQNKNEIALVLNSSSIADSTLYSYGIELPSVDEKGKYLPLKFEDIIGKKSYTLILNDAYYVQGTEKPIVDFTDFQKEDAATQIQQKQAELYALNASLNEENSLELTVSCVLTLKDDAKGSIFSDGFMYTKELAEFYHSNCQQSNVVKTFKDKYLKTDASGNYVEGDTNFANKYILKISELNYLKDMIGGDIDENFYQYSTPNGMIKALHDYFEMDLSYEQIIDLYLQVYGASNVPTGVHVYLKSFEGKDDLLNMIDKWNDLEGVYEINFTDSTSFLTNMLKSLVNIISYVLVAFAAISLLVSSIMIAIITYTSVIERTKEIGVLRSVGASKRDVSRVFNAETLIIGLLSGLLGIAISGLLTIPINLILKHLTGIGTIAAMQPLTCVILVLISVVLTILAGLIPARIASKKDPVLALRSE